MLLTTKNGASMKRLIVKILMVMAVAAGGVNYLVYLRTGQSIFAKMPSQAEKVLQDVRAIEPPKLAVPKLLDTSADRNNTAAYKWVDKNGVVHYSDAAPTTGESAKVIKVNPDANMILGAPAAAPAKPVEPKTAPQNPAATVVPAGAAEALQKAREVGELMNQRQSQLDKAIETGR